MRGAFLRLFMAGFWFLWTGVVIPAHTRGMVPLVKEANGAVEQAAVCPMCAMKGSANGGKSVPGDKSGNCLICDLASQMSVSTGFVLQVPRAGVLGWVVMRDGAGAVYGKEPGLPVGSRAPPAGNTLAS